MDKFKKENENFIKFEKYINNLSSEEAKEFIIQFFKKYKYLLSNDISRVMDEDFLKIIQITEIDDLNKEINKRIKRLK
jgi:hypothetical protein